VTTRRRFLSHSAVLAAGALSARSFGHVMPKMARPVIANLNPDHFTRFVDPLPIPAVAKPVGETAAPGAQAGKMPLYRIPMRAAALKLHRDLAPTRLWTFGGSLPGLTLETRSGRPLAVEWANDLPSKHFLPIDHTLHGAENGTPEVRGVVHLHGGKTPADSDGYPEDWYVPGKSKTNVYPNEQDAALLWYHDHSMGMNRLNIYAGLFGLHIVRDPTEESLHLPSGKYEIPLTIFDRDLRPDGQLSYPVSADPENPWVPEVFGELNLVNGKIFPFFEVEARKYRFRILNAANGRFYRLLLNEGADFKQIGSDQGLLAAPVAMPYVQLAPGERADVVIDFSAHRGANILLSSDSLVLMQFRVGAQRVEDRSELPNTLRSLPRVAESSAVLTRRLTLDENVSGKGESQGMLLNKTAWHEPITEKPVLGTTEIWELVNLTEDIHPIHLHMVKFQILDRRPFETFQYMTQGTFHFFADASPPDANEMGWKDTVRVNQGTVTRIIVPFHGYAGRYVWHCHILEHEDNEMMRPYEIVKG
jgi:spore coat protein A, manganese oxidase